MPIYAYKCSACGLAKDVQKKISEALPVAICPHCGEETFVKQVTAASFQFKGGGSYKDDFRGVAGGGPESSGGGSGSGGASSDSGGGGSGGGSSSSEGGGTTPAASASGHSCGSGCGCA